MYEAPTTSELQGILEELQGILEELQTTIGDEYRSEQSEPDATEPAMDVRLQVAASEWHVHSGSPQYDQDHRGAWGHGVLERDTNCAELAEELLEEASPWD